MLIAIAQIGVGFGFASERAIDDFLYFCVSFLLSSLAVLVASTHLLCELGFPGTLRWQTGVIVWGLRLATALIVPAYPLSFWIVAMLVLPAFAGAAMSTAVRQPTSFEIWQFSLKTCFLVLTVFGIDCGFTRLRYEISQDYWPAVIFASMSIAGYVCGRLVLDVRYIHSTADAAWWNAMQGMLPELKRAKGDGFAAPTPDGVDANQSPSPLPIDSRGNHS